MVWWTHKSFIASGNLRGPENKNLFVVTVSLSLSGSVPLMLLLGKCTLCWIGGGHTTVTNRPSTGDFCGHGLSLRQRAWIFCNLNVSIGKINSKIDIPMIFQ